MLTMTAGLNADKLLRLCGSPGAQYLLFDADQMLVEINAGLASLDPPKAVEPATTFNLYSIAKTVTATAILQLTAAGKLKLENDATRYFPQLKFSAPFTIEMLLQHRAGIRNPLPISFVHPAEEDAAFNARDFADTLISRNTKLAGKPGLTFRYSNVGYLMLGRIVEHVSGMAYEDYVSRHIFSDHLPEGVLSFTIPDAGRHATGYHKRTSLSYPLMKLVLGNNFVRPVPGHWRLAAFRNLYVNGQAYGGLVGSARGLAAFGQLLLRGNVPPMWGQSDPAKRWLGWFQGGSGHHHHSYHPGGGGGYYAELRLYPELGIGSAVTRNLSGFSDVRLLDQLDAVFAAHFLQ